MHILIAPNAYKNSLTAANAAEAVLAGLNHSRLQFTYECFPIGDGVMLPPAWIRLALDKASIKLSQAWAVQLRSTGVRGFCAFEYTIFKCRERSFTSHRHKIYWRQY